MDLYLILMRVELGYSCMGGCMSEDARVPLRLSADEVKVLRAFYKGRKVRPVEEIKDVLPEVYARIMKDVAVNLLRYFGREAGNYEFFFLPVFRKVKQEPPSPYFPSEW